MPFNTDYYQQLTVAKRDLGLSHISREFKTEYQPTISILAKHFVGFETHLTWQDQRSLLYSSVPMHLIDETGLSVFVRSWLLRTVIQQLYRWNQEFFIHTPLTLSLPLTEKQWLLPGLPEALQSIAQEINWQAQGLVLEVEYSTLVNNMAWSANLTQCLKGMGVQVQIHNFIPSHSGVAALDYCKIQRIKLAQPVASSLARCQGVNTLWEDILNKINDLKITVTLPRIEDPESFNSLTKMYGETWHAVCAAPVDAYQATVLIQADARLAQLNLSAYLTAMNNLSQFIQSLLGETLVNRYWQQTCPNQNWLKSQISQGLQSGLFEISDDFHLSTGQIHHINQWVSGFFDRCSRVILNLGRLIKTSDLTLIDLQLLQLDHGPQQQAH